MKARKIMGFLTLFSITSAAGIMLFHSKPSPRILLSNVTAAPLGSGSNQLAVFLSIDNTGPPDRLLSASAPDAQSVMFSENHGVVSIPENSNPSLASDGIFLMLGGISGELREGRTLPVSLNFENAGKLTSRARLVAPRTNGSATKFGLFGIGDICQIREGEPAPKIELSAKKIASGWQLDILSDEFEFTPELVDGPHIPGTGHGHLYLNGLKLGRLYSASTSIGNLPNGQHEIRVTLSTNDHRAYVVGDLPVTASIRIHSD